MPKSETQHIKYDIRFRPAFKVECDKYACKLQKSLSSVIRTLLERELCEKTMLVQATPCFGLDHDLDTYIISCREGGESVMPSTEPDAQSASCHYHISTPEYGLVAVFENEDKSLRFGVTVYPYRHSAVLLIVDLTVKMGESGRLDLAKGIAPNLDEAMSLSPYSWETPKYRELCEQLGLNPDHHRPKYRHDYKELADRIVAEIDKDCTADLDTLARRNFWYDFLDLIRANQRPSSALFERVKRDIIDYEDAPFGEEIADILDEMEDDKFEQAPTMAVVHFLPSAFGAGFNASLIARQGEGCGPDGWHTELYQRLGGIALDFETNTQWQRTVRRRLIEQGVILVPRKVAETYMQTEGAYWVWSNGGFSMFTEIKARPPTPWETFIWRFREPTTPLSDAAIVGFNVARMRNGYDSPPPPPTMIITPLFPAEEG